MKIYEFRNNLKDAFDAALHGESVVIERGGIKYQLIADGVMPRITDTDINRIFKEMDKAEKPDHIFPVIKTKISPVKLANGLCKIHGIPLDNRGKCLQKGCKYA